jgi:nucleoid DNA-binding protein
MKKLVILVTLVLVASTAALANPVFGDKGAEGNKAVPQTNCCFDYNTDHEIELTVQTWNFSDSDSDADGILTLESTEVTSTNQGQIISAIKSEKKPKFKAGAELSKTVNPMDSGDLDGDGIPDILIGAEIVEGQLQVAGKEISKRSARTGPIKTETPMNKAELIEAMASTAGLSKADAKKALEGFIDTGIDKKDIRR